MSNFYRESYKGICEVNNRIYPKIAHNTSGIRSSPCYDLQSFYENFNPESNEDCMYASSCSQSNETHPCKETFSNTNSNCEIVERLNQITPEPDQPSEMFIDNCHWISQNIEVPVAKNIKEANAELYTSRNAIKKTIAKKKRRRTIFSTEQIIAMEQIFKVRPYIYREERLRLTERIQVSERAIKVWFQNRRRMSEKRENTGLPDSPSSVDTCDSNSDRLAYIEWLISERTDQSGNVALDDYVMTELVSAINDHLSWETEALLNTVPNELRSHRESDVLSNSTSVKVCNENDCIMYEPISPYSVLDEFL